MNLGGVRASNGRAPIAPILAFVVQDSLVTSALITPNVLLSDPSSIQSAWVSSSQWRIAYQSLVSERELREWARLELICHLAHISVDVK